MKRSDMWLAIGKLLEPDEPEALRIYEPRFDHAPWRCSAAVKEGRLCRSPRTPGKLYCWRHVPPDKVIVGVDPQ